MRRYNASPVLRILNLLISLVIVFVAATQSALAIPRGALNSVLNDRPKYDPEACVVNSSTTPATPEAPAEGSLQELANRMLQSGNVTYWTNNGINTRDVVVALSEGKKAFTTSNDQYAQANREVDINPKILQFILEVAATDRIMVNALTDKDHSAESNHYKGQAVDLDNNSGNTSASIATLNQIAAKYGGTKNNETTHHHYDFEGSGGPTQNNSDTTSGSTPCACSPTTPTTVGGNTSGQGDAIFTKVGTIPFSGPPITPTGIVLHWTAGSPNQSVDSFISLIAGRGLSVQLYIDGSGTVHQLVDQLNTLTAHAAGANNKTIGIEIAAGSDQTIETATEEINANANQKQAVVHAVAAIQKQFNIPTDGNVANLTGVLSHHQLSSDKSDVGDKYLGDVIAALNNGGTVAGANGPDCNSTPSGGGDPEANKLLGQQMAAQEGFTGNEWACLLELWTRESQWNHNETEPNSNNPDSSAYGIPQALVQLHKEDIDANYAGYYGEVVPGQSSSDYDYKGGQPAPQIKWGLDYIKDRYTTPCRALEFHDANNYY